jgi:hypothetical protein
VTGQVDEAGREESVYVCADMGPAGASPCPQAALRGDDYCYAHGKAWDEAHQEVELIVKSELDALRADRDRLAGQVAAIRALHAPFDGGGDRQGRCSEDGFEYPCATIRAALAASSPTTPQPPEVSE